ncbi:hypothetical protein QUV58_02940 [Succinatimonas hippei]|uniref:hypothetical protein n=1 Tax=Succinatimonas hippei TaxID=626938 RepID=UPI0025A39986|nr:hypothetical protein [Succinatimonas hippei]MDM8119763.1 hypothetical protein [Succinatimonas hippei]
MYSATYISAKKIVSKAHINPFWNNSESKEKKMHSIHSYPAKFPAFIASKAFKYAEDSGVKVNRVSDIFCGCGTVALEAKLNNKYFWGCDINPVATLIAEAKSNTYSIKTLKKYFSEINQYIIVNKSDLSKLNPKYDEANERIRYWFSENIYNDLLILKNAINSQYYSNPKYKKIFECIFSAILKTSSKWLGSSIKPQIDPKKQEYNVFTLYTKKFKFLLKAVEELKHSGIDNNHKRIKIETLNFLELKKFHHVDLIITSPPYVTSYEYADLHQLSTLWLDFCDDFRKYRKGTIGSRYNACDVDDSIKLNEAGEEIIKNLEKNNLNRSTINSVFRYYNDIAKVIKQCKKMLRPGGMILFVIGDTEFKKVKIENSLHLVLELLTNGYKEIKVSKRHITNKLLTPYRDDTGKFSSDKGQRKIYHEEFIITAING